jgi:hypothetical protein
VRRVLAQAGVRPLRPSLRFSKTGSYLPIICQTLENFPMLWPAPVEVGHRM